MASLGACLAAGRSATLAELAEATGAPISDVRLALRRLADRLEPAGMQVLDDGLLSLQVIQLRRSNVQQAVLTGPRTFRIIERESTPLAPKDVRVRVRACGVCASDLAAWLEGPDQIPVELGHEVSGEVVEVGDEVFSLEPGMTVTGLFERGFAEYAVASEDRVIPVKRTAEGTETLGEPLACIVSAAARTHVKMGDTVAVVGVGFMGLTMFQALRLKGAHRVIGIDVRDGALQAARRFGADETWKPNEVPAGLKASVESDDLDRGVDVVVEASGTQQGLTLAGELVRPHGQLVILGYHQQGRGIRQVDMCLWNWKALEILNAHERRTDVKMDCLRRAIDLLSTGLLNPSGVITDRFPLMQINEAFAAVNAKASGFTKAVVEVTG